MYKFWIAPLCLMAVMTIGGEAIANELLISDLPLARTDSALQSFSSIEFGNRWDTSDLLYSFNLLSGDTPALISRLGFGFDSQGLSTGLVDGGLRTSYGGGTMSIAMRRRDQDSSYVLAVEPHFRLHPLNHGGLLFGYAGRIGAGEMDRYYYEIGYRSSFGEIGWQELHREDLEGEQRIQHFLVLECFNFSQEREDAEKKNEAANEATAASGEETDKNPLGKLRSTLWKLNFRINRDAILVGMSLSFSH